MEPLTRMRLHDPAHPLVETVETAQDGAAGAPLDTLEPRAPAGPLPGVG